MQPFERPLSWSAKPEPEERFPNRGTPRGDLFGSPRQVGVVEPKGFDDGAQALAAHLKRRHPVILNLQRADAELARRMTDFGAGLAYALDCRLHTIAERLYLLAPADAEVSSEGSPTVSEGAFFNQL